MGLGIRNVDFFVLGFVVVMCAKLFFVFFVDVIIINLLYLIFSLL